MNQPGTVAVEELERFVASLFLACGVSETAATTTSRVLVTAELRGRHGHGLRRVRPWIDRLRAGAINPTPCITLHNESPVSALVDGDNGLGPVVATRATDLAIAKAQQTGLAWVGTRNSNHAGAAGVYPAMAVRQGLIGLYMAVGNYPSMAPWGGREPLLGTNPLAVAVPAGNEPDFELDIATTTTSRGEIRVRAEAGKSMPVGWVMDRNGDPITDPRRADEGLLTPMGGHKGSGLAMMVGWLAGVLNGGAFGRDDLDRPPDRRVATGQMILVVRPDLFRPLEEFLADMDRHIHDIRRSVPHGDQPVRVPGEASALREQRGRRDGIRVSDDLHRTLDEVAGQLGVDPP